MEQRAGTIRLFGTADDSIVDGPGLRFTVFVQGCTHRCPGCHNAESQDPEGGYLVAIDELEQQILGNQLIRNVTLSGGEPFEQIEACLELARRLKAQGYNLWVYSGYRFEDLVRGVPSPKALKLLHLCDVLVDGVFMQALHAYDLKWRGSSNQRVIDLIQTFEQNKVVLWEQYEDFPEVPPSW